MSREISHDRNPHVFDVFYGSIAGRLAADGKIEGGALPEYHSPAIKQSKITSLFSRRGFL